VDPAREEAYLSNALATEELGLSSKDPIQWALLINPASLPTKLTAVRNHIDEGRFQSAKDQIESILHQDPHHAEALSLIPLTINSWDWTTILRARVSLRLKEEYTHPATGKFANRFTTPA
jgi:uncharacterized protein HemY